MEGSLLSALVYKHHPQSPGLMFQTVLRAANELTRECHDL